MSRFMFYWIPDQYSNSMYSKYKLGLWYYATSNYNFLVSLLINEIIRLCTPQKLAAEASSSNIYQS